MRSCSNGCGPGGSGLTYVIQLFADGDALVGSGFISTPLVSDSLEKILLPMKATLSTSYRGPSWITNRSVSHLFFSSNSSSRPILAWKIAERAVERGELVHVGVDLFAIDVAFEEHHDRRLGVDLGLQAALADELVADELDFPDLLRHAFVDDEHDAVVGRLVAFEDADLDVVVAVAMVQIDDLALGFLHGVRIDRPADFEVGFLLRASWCGRLRCRGTRRSERPAARRL